VVLGAGGAARAVLYGLIEASTTEVRLANRGRARAEDLALAFPRRVEAIAWEARARALAGCGLLVNTTSLGMRGQPPLELDLGALPPDAVVADIVYSPLETPLLAEARKRGNIAVDGLGMLLHQAVPGFERWFGVRPEVTAQLKAHVAASLGGA
jgi:shikimate dehydrogenase